MTTYWQVAVSFQFPGLRAGDPPSKIFTTHYPLFLSLESAQAAVSKAAGMRVPFFDNYRGAYIYDPDQSPESIFIPGIFFIIIEPIVVDDDGASLITSVKSIIELTCKTEEDRLRDETGRRL